MQELYSIRYFWHSAVNYNIDLTRLDFVTIVDVIIAYISHIIINDDVLDWIREGGDRIAQDFFRILRSCFLFELHCNFGLHLWFLESLIRTYLFLSDSHHVIRTQEDVTANKMIEDLLLFDRFKKLFLMGRKVVAFSDWRKRKM